MMRLRAGPTARGDGVGDARRARAGGSSRTRDCCSRSMAPSVRRSPTTSCASSVPRGSDEVRLDHSAHEHAGRPRHLDARDHQRDPGLARAGRHLCRAERRARGQRRHLYRLCERDRGDGAGHQYRRRDAGSARRQSAAAVGSRTSKKNKRQEERNNPASRRIPKRARSSTTPSPIFAASPRSTAAMPTGPPRPCVPPQACRPPRRSRCTSST